MAAGLGFKDFTTGEVLTAADVDGYLMQGVWVFASAAARDAAVTSPQEGNFAYLKDTNVTTYYTGSTWANLDTTGMTNPMTTTADMIYSSSGSTPARLGIGTAGQVLQVNSGATAPEWATPAGGSYAGVRVTKSASQSIPNATDTVITFDTETFDQGSYHSTVTNTGRLTVPVGKAGYYQIYFAIQFDVNSTGDREISLFLNGTATRICASNQAADASLYPVINGGTTYYLAEGDFVQLTAYQDRGGALDVTNSSSISFGMNKVG